MSSTAPFLAPMLNVLLPVVVGGLLGLAGGLIGPPYLHRLQQKAERKKRQAEKFEELVNALYQHSHWLNVMKDVQVFGSDDQLTMSPMARVQAISLVYFPEFDAQIRELDSVADRYELWALQAKQKRLDADPTYAEGNAEAYKPYTQTFYLRGKELNAYARREFR